VHNHDQPRKQLDIPVPLHKRLDSNYFENIFDKKVKLHAYLFSVFNFKNIKRFSKIFVFVFSFDKNKNVKIKKIVQAT